MFDVVSDCSTLISSLKVVFVVPNCFRLFMMLLFVFACSCCFRPSKAVEFVSDGFKLSRLITLSRSFRMFKLSMMKTAH